MKKYFLYPVLGIFLLLLFSVITFLLVLFYKPETFINTKNLERGLNKFNIFKSYSWKEGNIEIAWKKWNDREIKIHFKDFCFSYESEGIDVSSCFEKISGDLNIVFNSFESIHYKSKEPLIIYSELMNIKLKEAEKKSEAETPPEIYKYWTMVWNKLIPDLDVEFKKIVVKSLDSEIRFDLKLAKKRDSLEIKSLDYNLLANPNGFIVTGPTKYLIPGDPLKGVPLYLREFKLSAKVTESEIPIEVTGKVEIVDFRLNAKLDLPVKSLFSTVEFKKSFLKTLTAKINLNDIQNAYKIYGPKKYPVLPAPLNVMNGSIVTDIYTESSNAKDSVLFKAVTIFDMKGGKQFLNLAINTGVPLNLNTLKPESVLVDLDLKKVVIQLPKVSKKSAPPQFAPDSRFKNTPFGGKKEVRNDKEGPTLDLKIHLEALNEKALHIRTNLLDEALRVNFDIFVDKGHLESGFVQVLPLKTTVFKRPIHLSNLRVDFNFPHTPIIEATILFPLPEYKISLHLEGDVSEPRYSFTSSPPLPQSDIYAVLLFGRPLSELGADDKSSAERTNQILSQGILSLSVLYFLAGSPVEYVGYDPESKNATAQIGLGAKSSLRIGGGSDGLNSTGVRRSLGKGWYLDTSAQSSSSLSDSNGRSYGVMLERIISY